MEIWLVIAIIVLCVVISLCLFRIYSYRRNIDSIIHQIEDIHGRETNQIVNIDITQRNMKLLINRINEVIVKERKSVIAMNKLNKRFRQSITNLSHDLRTPLTTAGGYIEMLKENISEAEKKEYIDIVSERQKMVRMLLEQLFEYARIESGEIVYDKNIVDVKNVFIDVLAMYYEDFAARGQEPDIKLPDEDVYIIADEKGLKRIFSNIIFNALVHGAGGYEFGIQSNNNGYELFFKNTSEPLSCDELEYLFDRFYTKDTSRNSKTTGLGLSIAKEITLRFDGSIWATYQEGKLCIYLWYPSSNTPVTT